MNTAGFSRMGTFTIAKGFIVKGLTQMRLILMDFQTSKNLGGIGALIMFLGPLLSAVNAFGGLLSIVGFILLLIALHSFADHYKEVGIFNNALYGFITGIVGVVVSVGAFVAVAISVITDIGITDWTNAAEWFDTMATETAIELFLELAAAAITAIVILFVFAIITAYLYRKSLSLLSSKSGIGLFGTAGLLLLIGAVLTIVVIGVVLIWISILIVAIAFFSMKPTEAESTPQPT